jgi:hypothetical protein
MSDEREKKGTAQSEREKDGDTADDVEAHRKLTAPGDKAAAANDDDDGDDVEAHFKGHLAN